MLQISALALAGTLGLLALPATAGADVLGQLTQLPGTAGCLSLDGTSEEGAATCRDVRDLDGPSELVISPDGRSAYAVTYTGNDGLLAFARDPATGALEQLAGTDGCLSRDGSGEDGAGSCTDVRALREGGDGRGMAFSSDGRFLYVASQATDAVVVFARDPATSRLTQLDGTAGCVSRTGAGASGELAGTCADGRGLDEPGALVVTPDGRHVIVHSYGGTDGGLAVFARDEQTGALSQLPGADGCYTMDGRVEGTGGVCTDLRSSGSGAGLVVSPDGRSVYVSNLRGSGVLVLSRDAGTGALTQLPGTQGCTSVDGSGEGGAGVCADGRALDGAYHMAISPDGAFLYVTAYNDPNSAVVAFARDAATSALTQLPGTAGCVSGNGASEDGPGTCADGRGIRGGYAPVVSADGRHLYVPQYEADSLVSFARDRSSGALTQLDGLPGCHSTTGAGGLGEGAGTCTDARGLDAGYSTALSPDGAFLYATGFESDAISVFSRQVAPACDDVTVAAAHAGSVSVPLRCRDANGDAITRTIAGGPAGGSLGPVDQAAGTVTYTARGGFSGRDTFTFAAADATSAGLPATVAVDVAAPRPTPGPFIPGRPAPDTTPPRCTGLPSRSSVRDLRRGQVRLRLRCDEPARLSVRLLTTRIGARRIGLRARTLGRGTGRVQTANRTTVVVLRVSARTRSRLRRTRTARLRGLATTLRLAAADAAGNRRSQQRRVRLR